MTPRLLQMSGVIVDLTYRITAVPLPGQEAEVRGFGIAAGGGFNAMLAARRAGLCVAFGGTVGTGPLADLVEAALVREGIVRLRPRLGLEDQGSCVVLVDAEGERSFIAASGADGVATAGDLAAIQPGAGDWILLSGYALGYPRSRDGLTQWLATLGPGARLVFDPGPRVAAIPAAGLRAALRTALWVSANAAEATVLTGLDDPDLAAATLAAPRPAGGGAVVRVGAAGCWVARPGQPAWHQPGHSVRAIDTTGAGDSHVGHFIASLARGETAEAAALMANIAAALSTTAEGPATAPTHQEVLSVLHQTQRHPFTNRSLP